MNKGKDGAEYLTVPTYEDNNGAESDKYSNLSQAL